MNTELSIGGNKPLQNNAFILSHNLDNTVDISVFFLQSNAKVEGDNGMIFYGLPRSPCGSVHIKNGEIEFNLNNIPKNIVKLALTATVDSGTFAQKNDFILNSQEFTCPINTSDRKEAALILIELYLHNNSWKVRFVSQGFNGGLQPLAEHFGVDIAEPPQQEPQPNIPSPSINLSKGKINLTKNDKPIIIEKTEHITATVSWRSGTDYDIYALIMLKSGEQITVATFGAVGEPPLQNYGNGKVSHRGDIKGNKKGGGLFGMFGSNSQEQNTEIIDIRLSDDIVAVVPVAYSAQSNGSGSFYKYKVSLAINNGNGTSVDVTAENANNNNTIYTCIPGIIYNKKEGVEIEYLEAYSAQKSENRPKLTLNQDNSISVMMDAGPKNNFK